jgi:hypothetical protein
VYGVDWAGKRTAFASLGDGYYYTAALSPNGRRILTLLEPQGDLTIISSLGTNPLTIGNGSHSRWILGWFDDAHIVATVGDEVQIIEADRPTFHEVIEAPGRFVGPFPNNLG